MIGQWLAVHAPERLTHVVLANTTPRVDRSAARWRRAGSAVLAGGMPAIADDGDGHGSSRRRCSRRIAPAVASARRTLLATDPVGYAGCCAAIRDMDHTADPRRESTCRRWSSAATSMSSMPWDDHGALLAASIRRRDAPCACRRRTCPTSSARGRSRARCSISCCRQTVDRREAGFSVRRAVLGDAHVDRSLAGDDRFTRAFQELITDVPWGTIWTRPGLDRPHAPAAGADDHRRAGAMGGVPPAPAHRPRRRARAVRRRGSAAADCRLRRHPGGEHSLPRRAGRDEVVVVGARAGLQPRRQTRS